jgi:hypothetical protein
MKALTIKDLTIKSEQTASASARPLSPEEMKRVQGGRLIRVMVDGKPGGVLDDFALNMEIFKGNIGVKVV